MSLIFDHLKKIGWVFLVFGILLIIGGVLMIVKPIAATKALTIIVGICFVVSGFFHFFAYREADALVPNVGFLMVQGIMDVLIGLMMIFWWESFAMMIPVVIGFWMIFTGMMRIPEAFTRKKLGVPGWFWNLLLGILIIVGGFFVFSYPGIATMATLSVLGIYLIVSGISIIGEFFSLRKIGKAASDLTKESL